MQPWRGNPGLQSYLNQINDALQEQRLISFEYFDRNGRLSKREIEPNKLILKVNSWYVQGFCLDKQDFRMFKLSRMSNLLLQKEYFLPREVPSIISEFTDRMDQRQITVKLLIHESVRDKVVDYCGNEGLTPYKEHYFTALLPFIEDDSGYNLLLSFGDKCECLEPPEVREELIRRIHNLSRIYSLTSPFLSM